MLRKSTAIPAVGRTGRSVPVLFQFANPNIALADCHTYTFTRQPNGTTDIDVVVVREGKNLKGWMLGLVLGTIGRHALEKAFENSVKAIEARKGAARAAGAS